MGNGKTLLYRPNHQLIDTTPSVAEELKIYIPLEGYNNTSRGDMGSTETQVENGSKLGVEYSSIAAMPAA